MFNCLIASIFSLSVEVASFCLKPQAIVFCSFCLRMFSSLFLLEWLLSPLCYVADIVNSHCDGYEIVSNCELQIITAPRKRVLWLGRRLARHKRDLTSWQQQANCGSYRFIVND